MLPLALYSVFSLILIDFVQLSAGIRLESRNFLPSSLELNDVNRLRRRASISTAGGTTSLNDLSNTQYLANITVGGVQFPVIVDTGSADLWVFGNPKTTHSLNVSASIQYAVGKAQGTINTAPVEFLGYNISNQAYLLVNDTSSFSSNLVAQGISGLVGLGPGSGSVIKNTIYQQIGNSSADPILDRIFSQNASDSNYITFLLQRNGDPTQPNPGELTISEIIKGLEDVTSQTKIQAEVLETDSATNQHWTVQLDPNGLIGPDGKVIKKSSIVPHNHGRLYGVLDSGFTLPQVPRSVSDAIYGRVQGANYSVERNLWTFPCEQELNISISIGGVKYPVHPLDTSSKDIGFNDTNGQFVCAGTFQPITSAFSLDGQFDLILGMAFLRNTYTLMNFGNFVDGGLNSTPYVQLLSTTDPAQAHQDFVNARLGGVDTTGSSQYSLLPPGKGKTSPVPFGERVTHTEQKVIRYEPLIICISVAVVLALLGYGTWVYIRRRRARRRAASASAAQKMPTYRHSTRVSVGKGYSTLEDPQPPIYLQNMPSGGSYGYDNDYHNFSRR